MWRIVMFITTSPPRSITYHYISFACRAAFDSDYDSILTLLVGDRVRIFQSRQDRDASTVHFLEPPKVKSLNH